MRFFPHNGSSETVIGCCGADTYEPSEKVAIAIKYIRESSYSVASSSVALINGAGADSSAIGGEAGNGGAGAGATVSGYAGKLEV